MPPLLGLIEQRAWASVSPELEIIINNSKIIIVIIIKNNRDGDDKKAAAAGGRSGGTLFSARLERSLFPARARDPCPRTASEGPCPCCHLFAPLTAVGGLFSPE